MDSNIRDIICTATGASDLYKAQTIQSLWSGYGSLDRYGLIEADLNSVVVKHIRMPENTNHPRGWNTGLSHRRKQYSYEVETNWYENWAGICDDRCRIPRCLTIQHHDDELLIVLVDLDSSGFSVRKSRVSI